jgi:hypothetical protein
MIIDGIPILRQAVRLLYAVAQVQNEKAERLL